MVGVNEKTLLLVFIQVVGGWAPLLMGAWAPPKSGPDLQWLGVSSLSFRPKRKDGTISSYDTASWYHSYLYRGMLHFSTSVTDLILL